MLAEACAQDAVDAARSFGSVMLSPPCIGGARAWPVFRFGYVATSGANTAASGHRATTASAALLAVAVFRASSASTAARISASSTPAASSTSRKESASLLAEAAFASALHASSSRGGDRVARSGSRGDHKPDRKRVPSVLSLLRGPKRRRESPSLSLREGDGLLQEVSRRFLARHHPRSRGDPSHRGSGELPFLRARLDCRIV